MGEAPPKTQPQTNGTSDDSNHRLAARRQKSSAHTRKTGQQAVSQISKKQSESYQQFQTEIKRVVITADGSKDSTYGKQTNAVETIGSSSKKHTRKALNQEPNSEHDNKKQSPPAIDLDDHKKFSTRNSLRQSSTKHIPESGQTMGRTRSHKKSNVQVRAHVSQLMRHYGLDEQSTYIKMESDCFIRESNNHFYCLLCGNYNRITNQNSIFRHIESRAHDNNYWELWNMIIDRPPSEHNLQTRAINVYLNRWAIEYTLNQQAVEVRNAVIQDFVDLLQEMQSNCDQRVIGSYSYGASLSTSNVNLELIHPNSHIFAQDPKAKDSIHHKLTDPDAPYGMQFNQHTIHYDLVPNATDTLYKIGVAVDAGYSMNGYFSVTSDLNDLNMKPPRLRLLHRFRQIHLEITCSSESSFRMANLLRLYLSMDERAKILSTLVKYWASQCNISSPPGTYPPETYVIMVICFLQRTDPPVLPCLHELFGKTRERTIDLSKKFAQMTLDEDSSQQNHEKPEKSDINNIDYNEDDLDYDTDDVCGLNMDALKDCNWKSDNKSDICKLFIDFMLFIYKEMNDCSTVLSIRTLKRVAKDSKLWNTQVKPIEHPLKPLTNLSRVLGSERIFQYIRSCFRWTYHYFTSLPLNLNNLSAIKSVKDDPRELIHVYVDYDRLEFYFRMKQASMKQGCRLLNEMIQQNLFARDVELVQKLIEHSVDQGMDPLELPSLVSHRYTTSMLRPGDAKCMEYCSLCKRSGHRRNHCPMMRLQKLDAHDITNPNFDIIMNLDAYFLELYDNDAITPHISAIHESIVYELSNIINNHSQLTYSLTLFGSTVNQLGSYDSDLDICVTVDNNPTGYGVDCVKTLAAIKEIIDSIEIVEDLEPILTARVPILKFKYKNYDIDLSMYNQCAIHNSRLLKTYSQVDDRLPKLFYLVKRYAKSCGIADASRGALSSYAWSLLVIHFLQHTEPPILPVLQETKSGQATKGTIGVNGWNVWFQDNVDFVKSRMAFNDANLTQLFKQFLLYYANFDFVQNVISVRKKKPITRFIKNWTNCMIAIEDPFELTYNLSSRVDDQMAIYILNSFAQAYRVITNFQKDNHSFKHSLSTQKVDTLFDGYKITAKKTPPYRGCRQCHRIGHRVGECPERRKAERQLKPKT